MTNHTKCVAEKEIYKLKHIHKKKMSCAFNSQAMNSNSSSDVSLVFSDPNSVNSTRKKKKWLSVFFLICICLPSFVMLLPATQWTSSSVCVLGCCWRDDDSHGVYPVLATSKSGWTPAASVICVRKFSQSSSNSDRVRQRNAWKEIFFNISSFRYLVGKIIQTNLVRQLVQYLFSLYVNFCCVCKLFS